jgi:hypothetical protein
MAEAYAIGGQSQAVLSLVQVSKSSAVQPPRIQTLYRTAGI